MRDLTYDLVLIDYLADGVEPAAEKDRGRCREAARFLKWENGALWILRQQEWLMIPAVAARKEVIQERHILLRHAGVNKLVSSLKQEFWWNSMVDDVAAVVRECDSC